MTEAARSTTGFADAKGTRLYSEIAGAGHPLLLLHGGWVDSRMWDEQFDRLARDYRVIRYDLRGHGRSAIGSEPYSHVDDLDGLLTALGIDTACLLGLSLGGSVATAFAITRPERVDALVMVSTSIRGVPLEDEEQKRAAAPLQAAQRGDRARAIELFIELWVDGLGAPAAPRVRQQARAMLSDYAFPQFSPGFPEERWPATATLDRAGSIRAPTLIVVGANDQRVFHRAAEAIQGRLATARKVVIEDAGEVGQVGGRLREHPPHERIGGEGRQEHGHATRAVAHLGGDDGGGLGRHGLLLVVANRA